MMKNLSIRTLVLAVVSLLVWHEVTAQEGYVDEFDYRRYKFYDDAPDDDISLWGGFDEVAEEEARDRSLRNHNAIRYALSYVQSGERGYRYDEERTTLSHLAIDYTTARHMRSLGFDESLTRGMSHSSSTAALGSSAEILSGGESRLYDGHSLRADFSGRNYIAGLDYRGIFTPQRRGVALDEGWSLLSHARVRTGRDIYVDGIFSNVADVAFGATYASRNDNLDIVLIVPWSQRGLRQASTAEAYSLTNNTLYNPSWGMQSGRTRNSRVATTLRPEVVARWQRRVSATTTLNVAANIYFDRRGRTSLAWFDAPTAAPDNYKYMPSYFDGDDERRVVERAWLDGDLSYTQVDWDDLYHTNLLQSDGSARYAVVERRTNTTHLALNCGAESRLKGLALEYGVELRYDGDREFKLVNDLLGADHIADIDYFLRDDSSYSSLTANNLHTPNRLVTEGDRFGYDYRLSRLRAMLYAELRWQSAGIDFTLGARVASDITRRRGYYSKEIFAGDASYGPSRSVALMPAMLFASAQYRLDSHSLAGSFMVRGESPDKEDMFLQCEYNNRTVARAELATTVAAEIAYLYTAPKLSLEAMVYAASTTRRMDVVHYYDDIAGEYVDAVVSGAGGLHYGIDIVAQVAWTRYLYSNAALRLARYRYHRNPEVVTYADNDNDLIATSIAQMRGCRTGAPEVVLYGDVGFRHRGWRAELSAHYWALAAVEGSVVRRTERVLSYASSVEEAEHLAFQQRLPDAFTLDVSLSKLIYLADGYSLNIQFAVRNLLGSSVITDGYEQHRISRRVVGNRTCVAPFDNRLMYAYPRLVTLAVSLWF